MDEWAVFPSTFGAMSSFSKQIFLIGWFREISAELSLSKSYILSLKTCLEEMSSQIEIFRREKKHYKSFVVTLCNAGALWIFLPQWYIGKNVKWKMNKLWCKNCVILKAEVFPEVWVKLFRGKFSLRQEMQVFLCNCFHGGFLPNLPGGECAPHCRDAQQLLWELGLLKAAHGSPGRCHSAKKCKTLSEYTIYQDEFQPVQAEVQRSVWMYYMKNEGHQLKINALHRLLLLFLLVFLWWRGM